MDYKTINQQRETERAAKMNRLRALRELGVRNTPRTIPKHDDFFGFYMEPEDPAYLESIIGKAEDDGYTLAPTATRLNRWKLNPNLPRPFYLEGSAYFEGDRVVKYPDIAFKVGG